MNLRLVIAINILMAGLKKKRTQWIKLNDKPKKEIQEEPSENSVSLYHNGS